LRNFNLTAWISVYCQ